MLTQYLLTLLAVAVMAVLIELVLPDGQINKYVKSIFSIVFIFALLSPIPKLLNLNFSFTSLVENSKATSVNYDVIKNINMQKAEDLTNAINTLLTDNGFFGADVLVVTKSETEIFKVDKIYIDLTNLVLKTELQHINKYTTIKELLTKNTELNEEQIVFYGWEQN